MRDGPGVEADFFGLDFNGRFVDDSSTSLFGTVRFFVPTGK